MRIHGLACTVIFGLLSGCAQPPTAEIDIAEARVERAKREGAARYAPEILLEAEEALARAQALQSDSSLYQEAVQAAGIIKPQVAIPMHIGRGIGSQEAAEQFKQAAPIAVEILPIV